MEGCRCARHFSSTRIFFLVVCLVGGTCLFMSSSLFGADGFYPSRQLMYEKHCVLCHGDHDKEEGGRQMMTKKVIVEIRVPKELSADAALSLASEEITVEGFHLDRDYEPVPVPATGEMAAELQSAGEKIIVVRGTIDGRHIEELKSVPRVVGVYTDARVEPFER